MPQKLPYDSLNSSAVCTLQAKQALRTQCHTLRQEARGVTRLHEYPSTSTAAAVAVVWYRLFSTTFILRIGSLSAQIPFPAAPHAAQDPLPSGQAGASD